LAGDQVIGGGIFGLTDKTTAVHLDC